MRWALESEQEMLIEALSGWLDRAATPAAVRAMLAGDRFSFEDQLATEGWLAIGVAEESGGQGGGLLELALVAEQLARRAAPSSSWLATVLAVPALDGAALDSVLEGRLAALALEAGAPLDAPSPFSNTDGALTGTVSAALGADHASLLLVPTNDCLYLVDADSPGVTVTPRLLLDRSRGAATVTLDGAIGTRLETDATDFLATATLRAAVLVAADSLGAAARMLELAVEYSKQRTQFGAAIGSFQAMKHAAATMLVGEEASRSIVYYAAASVDGGFEDAPLAAAAAKAQVTRSGSDAAESALTMHGAIGYTEEHDLQLLYKRAKLDLALYGEPAVWNERIAGVLELV